VKPSLAPLTDDELKPWQDFKTRVGYPVCNCYAIHSQASDRRDAALMSNMLVIPAKIDTWKARNRWPMEGRFTRAWVGVTVIEMAAAGVDIGGFA
jgi:hypothetical protein